MTALSRTGSHHLLFYEYFPGGNGAGISASHQTGWTGLAAPLIELIGKLDPQALSAEGTARGLKLPLAVRKPRSNLLPDEARANALAGCESGGEGLHGDRASGRA